MLYEGLDKNPKPKTQRPKDPKTQEPKETQDPKTNRGANTIGESVLVELEK